jgi:hypothetical protein
MLVHRSPEAAELLASATDFHRSVWLMLKDDPDNGRLMGLH